MAILFTSEARKLLHKRLDDIIDEIALDGFAKPIDVVQIEVTAAQPSTMLDSTPAVDNGSPVYRMLISPQMLTTNKKSKGVGTKQISRVFEYFVEGTWRELGWFPTLEEEMRGQSNVGTTSK